VLKYAALGVPVKMSIYTLISSGLYSVQMCFDEFLTHKGSEEMLVFDIPNTSDNEIIG
jgi:hypothetical protein